MSAACHLCGGILGALDGARALSRVTSDCRPWPAGGRLARCHACGVVQKVVDDAWRDEARRIYQQYALYWQGDGRQEQRVLSGAGEFVQRSRRLLDAVVRPLLGPAPRRYLDFGCGTGETVRAATEAFPAWTVLGYEPNPRPETPRDALSRWDDVPDALELVSLLHVLEHIPGPAEALRAVAAKLAPGGRVLLQVPWYEANPFDLVIADHCTHFSPASLSRCVREAGLRVELCSTAVVRREITLVAARDATEPRDESGPPEVDAEQGLAWLASLARAAQAMPTESGVFGTAIAGMWVAGQRERVAFFVDEDPSRQGHRGPVPVYAPEALRPGSEVFVPLVPGVASLVGARLRALGLVPTMPPAFPGPPPDAWAVPHPRAADGDTT